jgi:heavy metal translocating P-type ATPase
VKELVASGVLNAASNFEMVATSSAEMSTYAGIIRLVKQAQARTSPAVRLANVWAVRFVPLAILLSLGTLLMTHSIDRMVAVLVTATPCPLILAVPIAVVSGMSRAAKMGIIIKGGAILELLANADVVMLDKTGTLTHGGPAITAIECSPLHTPEKVLQIAATIDQYSNHVVAKAIVAAAKNGNLVIKAATNLHEEHGVGITGEINGDRFAIGQFTETPEWLSTTYPLMVGVKADGILIGVLGMADPIRNEAAALMTALKAAGITKTFLVTGDRLESAQLVADQVGITDVYATMSAQGKLDLVETTMANTRGTVIFVGDGINDAPALAAANVGVALGARGATAASESADVVIVEDSIIKLANVIEVAKFAHRKALQSAQIGMGLSLLAMFAAGLGFLTSAVGAGVQEIIDILAILWALTTLNFKAL